MSEAIRTYKPGITVTLVRAIQYKNGAAARYLAANNSVDLTPFLGSDGSVVTHKDITKPLGTFSITFPDKRDSKASDSLYGLISPMDYIEIRMAREAWRYSGQDLPIVMRGFVSEIRRSQAMGEDGRPRRAVTVQGQDFGKMLTLLQIFYQKNYELGQNLLTVFRFTENYAVKFKAYPASEFVQEILNKIVNPEIKKLWHASALAEVLGRALTIQLDASVKDGTIQPYYFQGYTGNLWGLLRQFADLYWNELFIEDKGDGIHLVYRPLPYKNLNGRFIANGKDPGSTLVTLDDISSIEVSRSDEDVANFYWVQAPQAQLFASETLLLDAYSHNVDYFLQNNPNVNPALYGIRKMEVATNQAATNETTSGANLAKDKQQESTSDLNGWIDQRRDRLIEYNKDNVLFEHGNITLKGNEHMKAGTYLDIDYGAYRASYYAQAITQTFVPFQAFTTRVRVTRGTGFIARTKTQTSPYLAEQSGGVYG